MPEQQLQLVPVDLPEQLHEHLHSASHCLAMPTNLPEHLPVHMPAGSADRHPLPGRVFFVELLNFKMKSNIILILDFSRRLLLAADVLLDILSADLRAAADDKRSIVGRAMRSSRARRFHQSDVSNPAFCTYLTGNSMRSE